MISVVIPTLNAEGSLPRTLAVLVPAMVEGLVRQVIVVDGGSTDRTRAIVEDAGADLVVSERGRGTQLAAGATQARFPWLLFLHADTVLEEGWMGDAQRFIEAVETGRRRTAAAAFRFAVDDDRVVARVLERAVGLRCGLLSLPYGDQGLIIPRQLYEEVGGFRPLPLMEDVDLVTRLGRRRLCILASKAITSSERYRRDGYLKRSARNLSCLALYKCGAPISVIQKIYDRRPKVEGK